MQISLFTEQGKTKTIVHVPTDKITTSWLNPRRTRPQAYIDRLADRMQRNGFEITRALWAYAENGHYEVFAGGTRLEAAKVANIETVPVVLHEGYSEDELTRLADEDNENDEYHAPVSVVDVWMDYKRLADAGWTQQRIADAKGIKQSHVALRLKFAEMPQSIAGVIIKNDFLKESHAAEILKLSNFDNLSPWMTFEFSALHTIDKVLGRARMPTAKQFADAVAEINGVIALANELYQKLPPEYRDAFVSRLSSRLDGHGVATATTKADVTHAYNIILREMLNDAREREEEAARQASAAEQERLRLERDQKLALARDAILAKFMLGNSEELSTVAPEEIKLLLTDPPYGMNFQSNRRIVKTQAPKLINDDDGAIDLLATVLGNLYPKMAINSFAIVWVDWEHYSQFEKVVIDTGFKIRTIIVWNKPNHGSGDLEGTPAPKHEWAIFAVKGNPKLNFRFDNVMAGNKFIGTEHPTEKPIDLIETLIKATTSEGDIVADPFAGGGSTPITAFKLYRDIWACELDEQWYTQSKDRLFDAVEEQLNA